MCNRRELPQNVFLQMYEALQGPYSLFSKSSNGLFSSFYFDSVMICKVSHSAHDGVFALAQSVVFVEEWYLHLLFRSNVTSSGNVAAERPSINY